MSAFSSWEKELSKIVFDPRYLLLTSKERKQVFEKYVKERAEEERREKRNKLKEKKEEFRRLLEEVGLNGKSTFSEFASKYSKDERFKNIEKMRERESLFDEFILEVRRREKEEKAAKREQVMDFVPLVIGRGGMGFVGGERGQVRNEMAKWIIEEYDSKAVSEGKNFHNI